MDEQSSNEDLKLTGCSRQSVLMGGWLVTVHGHPFRQGPTEEEHGWRQSSSFCSLHLTSLVMQCSRSLLPILRLQHRETRIGADLLFGRRVLHIDNFQMFAKGISNL